MHRERRPTWGGGTAARAVALSLGLVVAAEAQAGPPPQYTVQIIQNQCGGPFPDSRTIGTGLNNRGQVCGFFWPCDGDIEDIGFVWSAETGIVPIAPPPGVVVVTPADMNDKGQLAGKVRLTSGFERGFLLSDGEWVLIEPVDPSGHSSGNALNESGAVAGMRWSAIGSTSWGYIYQAGTIVDIVPRLGSSIIWVKDLSQFNQVAGARTTGSVTDSFIWFSDRFVGLPGLETMAFTLVWAVSDCSVAVGETTPKPTRGSMTSAVHWDHALPTELPMLPGFDESKARDISEHLGIIVGSCSSPDAPTRGVMWCDDKVYDLNTLVDAPSVHLGSAVRINEIGQILCIATVEEGWYTASALLTPCPLLVGDLDGDGAVDGLDIAMLLAAWGTCAEACNCPMDLDDNQIINGFDLAILLANWS